MKDDRPEQLKISLAEGAAIPGKKKSSQTAAKVPRTKEVTAMNEPIKSADFETMLLDLEKVVTQLEGELKLEEALALFERGLGLSQQCEKFLKAAEQRIEVLKRSATGAVTTETFTEEAPALTT